jgi:phage-related protein
MRVVRLKRGARWTVCALCDENDPETCQVLEYIASLDQEAREEVIADLKSTIPDNPQDIWGRMELCKKLDDDWFEFRWNGKFGARRILCFFEPGFVVICGHGVSKKKNKIPAREMEKAQERLKKYREAKRLGKVEYDHSRELLVELERESEKGK